MSQGSGAGDPVSVSLEAGPEERGQPERRRARRRPDDPFAILVVGDFRGVEAGARPGTLPPFGARSPRPVDRDDLDRVLASLAPSIRIPGSDDVPEQRVDVRELDDFHPDRLLERAPVLRALRRRRDGGEEGEVAPDDPPSDAPPRPSGSEVLDEILASGSESEREGDAPAGGPGDDVEIGDPLEAASDLDAFIRRITRPHEVEGPDPDVGERLAELDRATSVQLRRLLHDRGFRALEARWRALSFLVRRLETGPDLKVFVLQADRDELVDAAADGGLDDLLGRTSDELLGGAPWAVVVPDLAFGAHERELEALAGLARAGRATDTAFLAEPDPSLLGLDDAPDTSGGVAAGWAGLRAHDGAGHLALLLPRFLLRLPYAEGENPCEALDFQELEEGEAPDPGQLLWGHPGMLGALLLGTAFRRDGWGLRPGDPDRVERLPLGVHRGPDGTTLLPTTEIPLDPGDVRELLEAGFAPVTARAGEGSARVPRLRPVAEGAALLAGPW